MDSDRIVYAPPHWPSAALTRGCLGLISSFWVAVRLGAPNVYMTDDAHDAHKQGVGLATFVKGMTFSVAEAIIGDTDEDHANARAQAGAREAMYDAIGSHIERLRHALSTTEGPDGLVFVCDVAPEYEAGILALDERIAIYLGGIGPAGKLGAENIRERARARVERARAERDEVVLLDEWVPDEFGTPPVLRTLARVLWRDEVGPRIERERHRAELLSHKPASIARAVSIDYLDLATKRYDTKERDGQKAFEFPNNRGWVLVPSVFDSTVNGILNRGVNLLSSELGIDLLEWQVTTAHSQWAAGNQDFRRIVIEGGYKALAAEHLGRTSKGDAERVRAIIHAMAHLRFETYGVRGNLLSYAEPTSAAPGRKAVVTITLGDMLLYGYASELKEKHGKASLSSREARRLVPILGKTAIVGRTNEHAAQRRMVWRLAILLRDRADELARNGAVRITLDDWTRLADEAAMPRSASVLARVLDAWKTGDSDTKAPPLIELVGRDTYTLHKSRREALDFLIVGGKRTIREKARGKASVRLRDGSIKKKHKQSST